MNTLSSFCSFLGQTVLIMGVANKKSVATYTARTLQDAGARIILTVQKQEMVPSIQKLFPDTPIFVCDVTSQDDLKNLSHNLKAYRPLHGVLHSVAFAPFRQDNPLFHNIPVEDFLQAAHVSCFSLVSLCSALKEQFHPQASVVTVSVSHPKMAAYGLLGPIKSALETLVAHMAKSFSHDSSVRFNAVCAGPLKTSASAGIPDYLDYYLFAEQLALRKQALQTQEVANAICFLLNPSSSGINGQRLMIDAGLDCNGFDETVVKAAMKQLFPYDQSQ
jgi:enoyl-[acyl-carrier protein] reductase I